MRSGKCESDRQLMAKMLVVDRGSSFGSGLIVPGRREIARVLSSYFCVIPPVNQRDGARGLVILPRAVTAQSSPPSH